MILDPWVVGAIPRVEAVLDAAIDEFLVVPYKHRTEHCWHSAILDRLRADPFFTLCSLDGGERVSPVAKEWPEPLARPEKRGRRGNVDVAVLSPATLSNIRLDQFRQGWAKPAILIEVGLDYGAEHLACDAAKLCNSAAATGYLVHLQRQTIPDAETKRILLAPGSATIRTLYAGVFSRGTAKLVKRLNDSTISAV